MSRILSATPAAAVVVWAMVSLAPPAVANETAGPPTAAATSSSQPGIASDQPSGHGHATAAEGSAPAATPAPETSPPQPDPAPVEVGQDSEHAEGHNPSAEEQTPAPGDAATTGEEHGADAEEHSKAPPTERPRALVLGGFGVFNGAVMVYAGLLRRKRAPAHQHRDARAAASTTDTVAKES